MKVSNKTIGLIVSLVTVAAAGGIYYYASTQDSGEVLSWMDSSWVYRKSIDVANAGGTPLTNEQVLVEIDTATLISTSKLQADCDDLRFVDSDDSTSLDYWVEGGCNTSATQVWVEIPTLPGAGSTIYMYYGNDSATNAEQAWSGNFISLSTVSCPTGWSRNTDFDNNLPMGSNTYGTTGGATTHNHTISESVTGSVSTWGLGTGGAATDPAASATHTHTLNITTSTNSNMPPYKDMIFCENTDLLAYENMVAMAVDASTFTNWSAYTNLNSNFPRGASSIGGSGGTTTHTHTTGAGTTGARVGTTGGNYDDDGNTVGDGWNAAHTHSYGASTTASATNLPAYYTVRYLSAASSATVLPSLTLMADVLPPLGWESVSSLIDKFPYGSDTAGSTGGDSTHTHTGSVTIGNNSLSVAMQCCGGSISVYNHNHGGSKSYTTVSGTKLPPYNSTLFIKRQASEATTLNEEEPQNNAPNAPSTPYCEGTTNPTAVSDTTPEFSAIFTDSDTSDTADYYQIQVNTASDFTGTVMWDSTKTAFITPIVNGARSTDISYAGSTLVNGTTYYWRIKFWDNTTNNQESPWSTTQNFLMNYQPNAPTNILIQGTYNPSKLTDTTPTISAIFTDLDETGTADYYEIEINTTAAFDGTSMWDTGKTATSVTNHTRSSDYTYSGTSLSLDGTKYYLRMRWWDDRDSQSEWSTTQTFIMQGPPDSPSETRTDYTNLTAPTFSAVYIDPNGDSASAYEIEINDAIGFDGTSIWDTDKTSTTIISGARSSEYGGYSLTNTGDTYYWRIRFWDSDDTVSDWSTTMSFEDIYPSLYIEGVGMEGIKID